MNNGEWDPDVLEILAPEGDYLLVAPASNLIGYAGWQWISKAGHSRLIECAKQFRAKTGKALYVAEAFRSLETQQYYAAHPPVAGAAVARPGTSLHGLGLAVDVWSGIDTSFSSDSHVAFENLAKSQGWTNTGRNFGEPWHFQFSVSDVTAPAGTGTTTPITTEDDLPSTSEVADAIFNDPRFKTIINQEVVKVVNGGAFGSAVAAAAGPAAADAVRASTIIVQVDGNAQTGTLAQAVRDTRNLAQKIAVKLGA